MTPDEKAEFDRRRKSRATVMAVILIALCVLFYFITIAKIANAA